MRAVPELAYNSVTFASDGPPMPDTIFGVFLKVETLLPGSILFWGVSNVKITTGLQLRSLLQDRNDEVLCRARIGGRLQHDRSTDAKVSADFAG